MEKLSVTPVSYFPALPCPKNKADGSTVEWVRKHRIETPAAKAAKIQEQEDAARKARRSGKKEEKTVEPVEWETRLKVGSHYMTNAPPLPATKFEKIPLTHMLEQRHNRTHSALEKIDVTTPPEDFYLRASWVERDHSVDVLKKKAAKAAAEQAAAGLPSSLVPVYGGNNGPRRERQVKTNEGYKIMERTPLGLVDHESQWAKSKMSSPLVVPPVSDSSSSDESEGTSDGEVESKVASKGKKGGVLSFSSPKSAPM